MTAPDLPAFLRDVALGLKSVGRVASSVCRDAADWLWFA